MKFLVGCEMPAVSLMRAQNFNTCCGFGLKVQGLGFGLRFEVWGLGPVSRLTVIRRWLRAWLPQRAAPRGDGAATPKQRAPNVGTSSLKTVGSSGGV